jgi:hypothetical protein
MGYLLGRWALTFTGCKFMLLRNVKTSNQQEVGREFLRLEIIARFYVNIYPRDKNQLIGDY